jgi:GNAT superfamily N-acetyltransferase
MQQDIQLTHGDGRFVRGKICSLSQGHLDDIINFWRPMLAAMSQEDAFWDWALKKRLSLVNQGHEAYAIEHEDLAQGLLWIETLRHRSHFYSEHRLVYIEALTSAPWNRRLINPDPYFQGIGTLLLQFTRQRSLTLGYGGRVGLHALPGSESFYESRNMMSGGSDPDYDDMMYFEYGTL